MYMYFPKNCPGIPPIIERSTQDVSFPVFPENSHHFIITLGTHPCGLFQHCDEILQSLEIRKSQAMVQVGVERVFPLELRNSNLWSLVRVQSTIYPPLRTNSYSTIQIRGVAYTVRGQIFRVGGTRYVQKGSILAREGEREKERLARIGGIDTLCTLCT